MRRYCDVDGAVERWAAAAPLLDAQVQRVRELEVLVTTTDHPVRPAWRDELEGLYGQVFRALRLRGLALAAEER